MFFSFINRSRLKIGLFVVLVAVGIILAEKWIFSQDFRTRGRIMRLQILVIIQIGLGILSVFVWKNVVQVFGRNIKFSKDLNILNSNRRTDCRLCKTVTLIYIILAHCSYLNNSLLVASEPYFFALLSYFMLSLHVQLSGSLAVLKMFNFVAKLSTKHSLQHKYIVFLALFYSLLATLTGFYNAQRPPTIKHVTIPVKDLPDSLLGLTITHIPDIHIGQSSGRTDLENLVRIVNDIGSDIIVIVGDLVDGKTQQIKMALEPVQNLVSKHGTYFVTGNHEYYTLDVEDWFVHLKALGINVLHNSNVKISQDSAAKEQLCLAGTDDVEADKMKYDNHGFDLDKAVVGCSPDQPVVLLAHQPKAAKLAFQSKHRIDLVLSGHTHGGQFFPMSFIIYLLNPYYQGLYRHGDSSHVYVSQGTMGFPMRFMTSKEISVITLTSF